MTVNTLGNLRKTVEDGNGNVGKTIKLITEDKKHTWIMWNKSDIRAILLSCETSIAPFHVVCKTWSIFQQLSSIFSFRKRRWRQLNFSENRNKQSRLYNQSNYMLKKNQGLCRNIFTACWRHCPTVLRQHEQYRLVVIQLCWPPGKCKPNNNEDHVVMLL